MNKYVKHLDFSHLLCNLLGESKGNNTQVIDFFNNTA